MGGIVTSFSSSISLLGKNDEARPNNSSTNRRRWESVLVEEAWCYGILQTIYVDKQVPERCLSMWEGLSLQQGLKWESS